MKNRFFDWIKKLIFKKKEPEPIICGGIPSHKKKKRTADKQVYPTYEPPETKIALFKRLSISYDKTHSTPNYQKKIEHITESYTKKLFTLPLNPLAVPYFEEFLRTGKIIIGANDYIGKTRGFDALMFLRKEFRKKHVKTRLHGHSIVEI